jgi:hypothetical protein
MGFKVGYAETAEGWVEVPDQVLLFGGFGEGYDSKI